MPARLLLLCIFFFVSSVRSFYAFSSTLCVKCVGVQRTFPEQHTTNTHYIDPITYTRVNLCFARYFYAFEIVGNDNGIECYASEFIVATLSYNIRWRRNHKNTHFDVIMRNIILCRQRINNTVANIH